MGPTCMLMVAHFVSEGVRGAALNRDGAISGKNFISRDLDKRDVGHVLTYVFRQIKHLHRQAEKQWKPMRSCDSERRFLTQKPFSCILPEFKTKEEHFHNPLSSLATSPKKRRHSQFCSHSRQGLLSVGQFSLKLCNFVQVVSMFFNMDDILLLLLG